MILCRKCCLFLISVSSIEKILSREMKLNNSCLCDAVDVLAHVLRVVCLLWSTANLFKRSNGLWNNRPHPPRLLNLHSFGLVVNLVNTLPKWSPHASKSITTFHRKSISRNTAHRQPLHLQAVLTGQTLKG